MATSQTRQGRLTARKREKEREGEGGESSRGLSRVGEWGRERNWIVLFFVFYFLSVIYQKQSLIYQKIDNFG